MHVVNRYIEYTPVGTPYTQALKWLLAKGNINFHKVKPEAKAARQFKCFDLTKYCKCHQAGGHNSKSY